MLQFLHLNALNLLALVSMEKDLKCVTFYSFCVLVTRPIKYGHDHRK